MAGETQSVQPVGFNSASVMTDNPERWIRLARHPPFQLFTVETFGPSRGMSDMEHAARRIRDALSKEGGGEGLYQQYTAWHGAKGWWKNETPTGEPT